PVQPGYKAFLISLGYTAALCPYWFANPFFWAGFVLLALRRWGAAARAAGVASLLAASPLLLFDLDHLHIGYFAWLASMILATLWGLVGRRVAGTDAPVRIGPNRAL